MASYYSNPKESVLGKRKRSEDAETREETSGVGGKKMKEQMVEAEEKPSSNAMKMMKKMGYIEGSGLGKRGQGMVEPIPITRTVGKAAMGSNAEQLKKFEENAKSEVKSVKETVEWCPSCSDETREFAQENISEDWLVVGKPKLTIDDEDRYCSRELIARLLKAKDVFDTVDQRVLVAARARANPYETIKAGFFQNRAAMKTANLDKIFEWKLSGESDDVSRHAKNPLENIPRNNDLDRPKPQLFYFADVCAGPGGFSEYMLWRKAFYNAKGFGFTLAGKDDFKLERFKAAAPEYFEPFYGVKKDGNVVDPSNLESLEEFVRQRIHEKEKGVHLVMCDGGFSVEGQENIQEILSKRIYLCQLIVGLSLGRVQHKDQRGKVQPGANFLCKLFDIFTPFSMGLVYLMYISYERICIHKPITSRPANSERYIFCENLTNFGATQMKEFLVDVNRRMHQMADGGIGIGKSEDVLELVPDDIIRGDQQFMDYMRASCQKIAEDQIFYLDKYYLFAQKPTEQDTDQGRLREEALSYWELPDHIERPQEEWRGGRRGGGWGAQQNQQLEPANQTLGRILPEDYIKCFLPLANKRIPSFTQKEVLTCPDVRELRALLLTADKDRDEPMLLLSQGDEKLFKYRRSPMQPNGERVTDLNCTIPGNTLLLVQTPMLYKTSGAEGKLEPAGKCVWVLDAAMLNGDNVSTLDLKSRLAAARKFCEAINRRQICRRIQMQNRGGRGGGGGGPRYWTDNQWFDSTEMIVAEPMRLPALIHHRFSVKQIKGGRAAFFPVWAGDELRKEGALPAQHFLQCRGIRVQNNYNPNFKLISEEDPVNRKSMEKLVPRTFQVHNKIPNSSFYECFIGILPNDRWKDSFPTGHPHGGAITFHWSWEPDFNDGLQIENILRDNEHKSRLTLPALGNLLANLGQRQSQQVQQQMMTMANNSSNEEMDDIFKKEEETETETDGELESEKSV